MCVIIHKPQNAEIPQDLLAAALTLNRDGWGLMGFDAEGSVILERHAESKQVHILDALTRHRDAELVLHLRQRTRGAESIENAHPFKLAERLYLMHNGTLPLGQHGGTQVAGRSDTWHFVQDVLRPLHNYYPGLMADPAFLRVLELGLKPDNKMVLLDGRIGRIAILNRQHGAEFEGLWLSNTRWIDRRLLPLVHTPQAQLRSYSADELHFV